MVETAEPKRRDGFIIERLIRGTLAWLAAVSAGSVILAVLLELTRQIQFDPASGHDREIGLMIFLLPIVWAMMAFLTAIPLFVAVIAFRLIRVPRAWADVIFSAFMGGIWGIAMLTGGRWQLPDLDGALVWVLPAYIVAGGIAGFIYWRVAGRPGPPYRSIV